MQGKTLVIGASGQIGIELVGALRTLKGVDQVIATDIKPADAPELKSGPFEILNVLNLIELERIIKKHQISEVYLLAALLSATSEKNPERAWDLNMNGLFHVLDLAKTNKSKKFFGRVQLPYLGLLHQNLTPLNTL
jgi:nucleoside-diphosphate-sugar epimerase